MVVPDLDKEMRIKVDASDYVTGGVLSIKWNNEKWRLVVYLLKLLNEIERNYKIHDKEMLAVIRDLENWKHLLEGVRFGLIIKILNIS